MVESNDDDTEKVSKTTPSLKQEHLDQLKGLFPGAFTEGQIDFERLQALLGEAEVLADDDAYSFTWDGKQDVFEAIQEPTATTLKPNNGESVDFEDTEHIFIEGENLDVMKNLYKSYYNEVKMIYIDPPYNTGNDFVYEDDFAEPLQAYLEKTGQMDAEGNRLVSNPETEGRFHSRWLSMMYPRLYMGRQLLRNDGVMFVSVDDHEVHNLRMIMNEIFGEENFVECFIWKKSYGGGAKEKYAVTQHEYLLMYAKNKHDMEELWLPPDPEAEEKYYRFEDERGKYRKKPLEATKSMDKRENLIFPIEAPWGEEIWPERQWWWSEERVEEALANDEIVFDRNDGDVTVSYKQYLRDEEGNKRLSKPFSIIDGIYTQHGTAELRELFDDQVVVQFPKPTELIEKMLHMTTNKNDNHIVLDFFAGSCSTAEAVLNLNREDRGNRQFIMVQIDEETPEDSPALEMGLETIAEIGKERIRRAIDVATGSDGDQMEMTDGEDDVDMGFKVFELSASNFQTWEPGDHEDADQLAGQFQMFDTSLKQDADPTDVVYEIMLREGFSLNADISADEVASNTVYVISEEDRDGTLYVCLDERIDESFLDELESVGDEDTFVCPDTSLTDSQKINFSHQCLTKTL